MSAGDKRKAKFSKDYEPPKTVIKPRPPRVSIWNEIFACKFQSGDEYSGKFMWKMRIADYTTNGEAFAARVDKKLMLGNAVWLPETQHTDPKGKSYTMPPFMRIDIYHKEGMEIARSIIHEEADMPLPEWQQYFVKNKSDPQLPSGVTFTLGLGSNNEVVLTGDTYHMRDLLQRVDGYKWNHEQRVIEFSPTSDTPLGEIVDDIDYLCKNTGYIFVNELEPANWYRMRGALFAPPPPLSRACVSPTLSELYELEQDNIKPKSLPPPEPPQQRLYIEIYAVMRDVNKYSFSFGAANILQPPGSAQQRSDRSSNLRGVWGAGPPYFWALALRALACLRSTYVPGALS